MPLPRPAVSPVSPVPAQSYVDPLPSKILSSDLEEPVRAIVQFAPHLTEDQRSRLVEVLSMGVDEEAVPVEYGAEFDLAGEVQQQIIAVRAIREKAVGRNGKVRDGVASRDLNAVVTSGSTLLNALMKHNNEIQAMRRLRLLEKAVIEALREVSPELRDKVMGVFNERLGTL